MGDVTDPSAPRPLLIIDPVMVILFAVVGRASHAEVLDPLGVLDTGWPFLAAWLVGAVLTRAWRRPERLWPTGVVIWVVTVAAGMAIRIAAGDTAAPAFVIVATCTLALLLLGWRLVALLVVRARGRRRVPTGSTDVG